MELEIIYRDADFVAINKPCGLLVHRTRIAEEQKYFALQLLRDQLGQWVYPVHRLDRPTSGVLIFGLHEAAAGALQKQMMEKVVEKKYWAVVRGHLHSEGVLDYPLKKEDTGRMQEAQTYYKPLAQTELPIAVSRYDSVRYTLVEAQPLTGRMHQLRRHFAHLRHYIIGDKRHGERHHNRMFRERLDCPFMLLHAFSLRFEQPFSGESVDIFAPFPLHWRRVMPFLAFK